MENDHIFVKVDDYKSLMDTLALIEERLKQARSLVDDISKLKKEEDVQIEKWKESLNEIKDKMEVVDTNLHEVYN